MLIEVCPSSLFSNVLSLNAPLLSLHLRMSEGRPRAEMVVDRIDARSRSEESSDGVSVIIKVSQKPPAASSKGFGNPARASKNASEPGRRAFPNVACTNRRAKGICIVYGEARSGSARRRACSASVDAARRFLD